MKNDAKKLFGKASGKPLSPSIRTYIYQNKMNYQNSTRIFLGNSSPIISNKRRILPRVRLMLPRSFVLGDKVAQLLYFVSKHTRNVRDKVPVRSHSSLITSFQSRAATNIQILEGSKALYGLGQAFKGRTTLDK